MGSVGGLRPPTPPLKSAFGLRKCRPSASMDPGYQNVQDPRRMLDHGGAIWGPDGFLKKSTIENGPQMGQEWSIWAEAWSKRSVIHPWTLWKPSWAQKPL